MQIIPDKKYEKNSYVMFITICENRDNLKKYLENHKIQSLIYYGNPLHKHKASKYLPKRVRLTVSEQLASKVLALPHHQGLNETDIQFVCKMINKFYEK